MWGADIEASINGKRARTVTNVEAAYLRVIGRGHVIAFSVLFIIANESLKFVWSESVLNGRLGTAIALGAASILIVLPIASVIGNRGHIRDLVLVVFGRLTWWQAILVGSIGSISSEFVIERTIRSLGAEPIVDIYRDSTAFTIDVVYSNILQPLTETIVFQVVLQSLLRRFGMIPAAIATTILFAAYHFMSIDRLPNHLETENVLAIACGLAIFAFIRATTGSTLAVLLAHGGSNALNYLFATPHHIK